MLFFQQAHQCLAVPQSLGSRHSSLHPKKFTQKYYGLLFSTVAPTEAEKLKHVALMERGEETTISKADSFEKAGLLLSGLEGRRGFRGGTALTGRAMRSNVWSLTSSMLLSATSLTFLDIVTYT